MANEVRMSDMDKVMETLEGRERTLGEKASVGKAIRAYYPKLKELKDRKGFSVRELYEAFREVFPDMAIAQSTFTSYWHRAKAANEKTKDRGAAKQVAQAKPEKAVAEKPASQESRPEAQASKPVQQAQAQQAQPVKTPGFRTDDEIRAQGQDLVRMYRESGKMK